jgi:hypothetical protein
MFIFLDVTKPVLSNCPTDMTIDAYTKPSFSPPSVSDNSGTIKTFTISPENANTTMLITTSTETVTYCVKTPRYTLKHLYTSILYKCPNINSKTIQLFKTE